MLVYINKFKCIYILHFILVISYKSINNNEESEMIIGTQANISTGCSLNCEDSHHGYYNSQAVRNPSSKIPATAGLLGTPVFYPFKFYTKTLR